MADKKKTPKASKPETKVEKKAAEPKEKKATEKKAAEKKTDAKKTNIFKSIKQYFKDVKGETKKIVWESWPDTVKDTGVVLLVTVVIGAGVWICDLLFRQLFDLIYTLAGTAETGAILLQNLTNLL